jgi:hypothetical protein
MSGGVCSPSSSCLAPACVCTTSFRTAPGHLPPSRCQCSRCLLRPRPGFPLRLSPFPASTSPTPASVLPRPPSTPVPLHLAVTPLAPARCICALGPACAPAPSMSPRTACCVCAPLSHLHVCTTPAFCALRFPFVSLLRAEGVPRGLYSCLYLYFLYGFGTQGRGMPDSGACGVDDQSDRVRVSMYWPAIRCDTTARSD